MAGESDLECRLSIQSVFYRIQNSFSELRGIKTTRQSGDGCYN